MIGQSEAETIVTQYCQCWNEPDRARRIAILQQIWSTDGIYCDPRTYLVGAANLSLHIGRLLESRPDGQVVRLSRVDLHHQVFRFSWYKQFQDGTRHPDGLDYGEFDTNGRIRKIIGFFGPLIALSVD